MSDNTVVVFTSTNVHLRANDNRLDFVQRVEVEDCVDPATDEKFTNIVLHRLVSAQEDIINDMRAGKFTFKLFNSTTNGGYISEDAEISSFKMALDARSDNEPTDFLKQTIVIKAKSFVFLNDVRSESFKAMEQEDLENLIGILKENQEKSAREKVAAVLPKEEKKKNKKNKKG